jgi:hypothetical protein
MSNADALAIFVIVIIALCWAQQRRKHGNGI